MLSNLKTLKSKNELLIQQYAKREHPANDLNFPEDGLIAITNMKIELEDCKMSLRLTNQ